MSEDNGQRPHIIIKNEPAPPVKREYEGGGSSYKRANVASHSRKVAREADQLRAMFAKSQDSKTSKVYFKVEMIEDTKVESSKGIILENTLRAKIVGSPKENIAHVATTRESFNDLVSEIEIYKTSEKNVGKSKYAAIEGLSPIPFEEKATLRFLDVFTDEETEGEALVGLFPDLTEEDATSVAVAIKSFIEQRGGEVMGQDDSASGIIFKVKSRKDVLKDLANMFISVQGLDSIDKIIEYESIKGAELEDVLTVIPNHSKALACVIDSGVARGSRFLDNSIIDHEFPFGDTNGLGVGHGTFVASRIIFGDDLKGQVSEGVLKPDVRVLSICTKKFKTSGFPENVTSEKLMKVIRDVVYRWHKQIKVFNISMGCVPNKTGVLPGIRDDEVHPLAAEIDFLARKYDVLFIISAGNYPHDGILPSLPYPKYFSNEITRILSPSESMLGITVGSVAKEHASGSIAKENEPSPFTRRGPGFSGHRKPDLAAHGGNQGTGFTDLDYLMSTGMDEFGTSLAHGNGTSFSAPIITRLAAKLFERIPDASAPLIKAMLVHFSDLKDSPNFSQDELVRFLGNGLPISPQLTNSHKHSQTYLYQGEMDYRDMIEVPFYVPKGLVGRKGNNVLKVRATISYFPESSKVLKKGYCKSHIRTKIIKIDTSGAEKDVSFSDSKMFESGRYSTVIKMAHSFSSRVSAGDWKILVAHESRWTLKNPKTKFAVVITIEDPKREDSVDIYQMIRTEVSNKYQAEVQIREQIRV